MSKRRFSPKQDPDQGPVFLYSYHIVMRLELMNKLNSLATYVFEEMTSNDGGMDLARDFWKYLRSRLLDDMNQKVRISEYVYQYILNIDEKAFNTKYSVKLSNVKKSRQQMDFVCSSVSILLHYSDFGKLLIDWS